MYLGPTLILRIISNHYGKNRWQGDERIKMNKKSMDRLAHDWRGVKVKR